MKRILAGEPITTPSGVKPPALSDREVQVLGLIGKGMSRQEVAEKLQISEKTVSTYQRRLLVKLEMRNITDLLRYAIEEELVD